jgi:hypothetical protein
MFNQFYGLIQPLHVNVKGKLIKPLLFLLILTDLIKM